MKIVLSNSNGLASGISLLNCRKTKQITTGVDAQPGNFANMNMRQSGRGMLMAVAAVVLLGAIAGPAAAQSNQLSQSITDPVSASEELARAQWRENMASIETPSEGCFQASFPNTHWELAPCRAVSLHAHPIARLSSSGEPQTTGDGNDYALVASGLISKTVGSFPAVSGVTAESSVGVPGFGNGGILGQNEYTLQINTNANARTSACSGGASGCTVWQQFIYATNYETQGSAAVLMQYWLINYGASGAKCPGGYATYGSSCFKNSAYVPAPDVAITGLGNLKLTGTAAPGGYDTVTFANGTQAYSVSAFDSVLQIGTVWKDSEFNLVGDAGGSEAVFNNGAAVTVNVAAAFGSTAAPGCASYSGTTGETNNLNLGACYTEGGTVPSIQFTESLQAANANVTGFAAAGIEHAFYLGVDLHVHEAYNNGSWFGNDLTAATKSIIASPASALASYSSNGIEHVFFVGGDQHVHELYNNGAWWGNDLTVATNSVSAADGGMLTGFFDGKTEHVFFVGADLHVHELYYNGSWWGNDLTVAAKLPLVAAGSALSSFFDSHGVEHVFFLSSDQHVREIYYSGAWFGNDLTAVTKTPVAATGSALTSFYDGFGIEHVFSLGTDQHVHELYYSNGQWYGGDLTAGRTVNAAAGSPLSSFFASGIEHVFFVGTDQDVHELYNNGSWLTNDLTAVTKTIKPAAGTALASFMDGFGIEHVFSVDTDMHVHELYNTGSWYGGDTTKATNGPNALP